MSVKKESGKLGLRVRTMKKIIAILLAMTCWAWAHPEEWVKSPPATVTNQLEANQWAADQYKEADLELNQVWKQLTSKLGDSEKKLWLEAQLKWIEFRDAQALADVEPYQGGSIVPMLHWNSKTALTRMRTHQLKMRLKEVTSNRS